MFCFLDTRKSAETRNSNFLAPLLSIFFLLLVVSAVAVLYAEWVSLDPNDTPDTSEPEEPSIEQQYLWCVDICKENGGEQTYCEDMCDYILERG